MPTPKLDLLSVEVSKKAGDEVSVATADGNDFTSQQRLRAIHDARKSIYFSVFNQMKLKDFVAVYPEYIKEAVEQTIVEVSGIYSFALPADFRIDLAMKVISNAANSEYVESKRFVAEAEYESTLDIYSVFKANENNIKHVVRDNKVIVFGISDRIGTFKADLLYLSEPVDIEHGTTEDIKEPDIWIPQIKEIAYKNLLVDIQRKDS